MEITLDQKEKLPVPKYIWKILYDSENNKGIVFIVINNPFEFVQKQEFCENICKRANWHGQNWSNITAGYVFCCSVNDFQKSTGIDLNIIKPGLLKGTLTVC